LGSLPSVLHDERRSDDETSAVARYKQLRVEHSVKGSQANLLYWSLQLASIGLTATTPLLILLSNYPNLIKAIPAAIGALLGGLNGVGDWRVLASTHSEAADAMDRELVFFIPRIRRYAPDYKPFPFLLPPPPPRTDWEDTLPPAPPTRTGPDLEPPPYPYSSEEERAKAREERAKALEQEERRRKEEARAKARAEAEKARARARAEAEKARAEAEKAREEAVQGEKNAVARFRIRIEEIHRAASKATWLKGAAVGDDGR
jgi:hypothetical protein